MERLIFSTYAALFANMYFWRTCDRQEIDLVEERDGNFNGYEFKRPHNKPALPPASWTSANPVAGYSTITLANYGDFVIP